MTGKTVIMKDLTPYITVTITEIMLIIVFYALKPIKLNLLSY
jgi:hypothetical protein